MAEEEDLYLNPFFKCLKDGLSSLWSLVERHRYIVCVPKAAALPKRLNTHTIGIYSQILIVNPSSSPLILVLLRSNLTEAHILQPSPYYQGQYLTLTGKTVEIERGSIITKEGDYNKQMQFSNYFKGT